MKRSCRGLLILAAITAGSGAFAPDFAVAQIENFWLGVTPDWNDDLNWSNGIVPQPGEIAVFDDEAQLFFNVQVNQPTSADMVEFRNNTMNYVINVNAEGPALQANSLLLTGVASVTFENPTPGGLGITQFGNIDVAAGTLSTGGTGNIVVPPSGQTMISPAATLLVAEPLARFESNIINDGAVRGNGVVAGTVDNNGLVAPGLPVPGLSPGALSIEGNLNQMPGGVIQIEIAAEDAFDNLAISQDATFDGRLQIVTTPTAAVPNSVVIAVSGDRLGRFRPVETIGVDDDFYVPQYVDTNSTDVFLNIFPEGDMDLSTVVDVDDVREFVRALRNRDAYWNEYGVEGDESGDIDDDNDLDFDDIDEFAALVPGVASGQILAELLGVPEPSAFALTFIALGLTGFRRRRD